LSTLERLLNKAFSTSELGQIHKLKNIIVVPRLQPNDALGLYIEPIDTILVAQTLLDHPESMILETLAHDIKSPLAVINQTSQLLGMRAETLGDPEIIEHAKTIEEFTKNITDFVTELLDYAKMGRSNRPMEDVDLTSVVADVQKNLAAIIDQKQASIEVAEPLPTVKGDRVQKIRDPISI
jgi:K+-sensing histidine kinase KdpD